MSECDEAVNALAMGWSFADRGEYDTAERCYKYAQEKLDNLKKDIGPAVVNPDLQLTRFNWGNAEGLIRAPEQNENVVFSIELMSEYEESESIEGLELATYTKESLKQSIEYYTSRALIKTDHIMVLSTGRCGTVSLFNLFEQTQYIPYHTYFYQVSAAERQKVANQFITGKVQDIPILNWYKSRKAEVLGCIGVDRPMITMNHLDTVFAPIFAYLYGGKFIYLRRDPEEVFKSFYGKNQWSETQLSPTYCAFDPYRWKRANWDLPRTIAWYIKFTEDFSLAFGELMGDRFIEISSNKLFEQNEEEIKRLIDFTKIDLSVSHIKEHFKFPYNEKAHKKELNDNQMQAGLEAFRRAYDSM